MTTTETILAYLTCYILLFIITWVRHTEKSNRLFDSTGRPALNPGSLLSLHVSGILWLAIVPTIIRGRSVQDLFTQIEISIPGWLFMFLLIVLAVFAGWRTSHEGAVQRQKLSIGLVNMLPAYFIVRILFLAAYEYFFRGILLMDCINWIGIIPAIAVSTVLTVLVHVFTNRKEMVGCIPFGIVLCICTIEFNAVWPAMIIHIALSLAYELPLVKQLRYQLKLSR